MELAFSIQFKKTRFKLAHDYEVLIGGWDYI